MLDVVFGLPAVVSGAIVVLLVIALALFSYAIARALLAHGANEERRELAGSVIFRVSALHGLVLALVFAQEVVNLRDVSTATAREAALVGNVFYDLERYDPASTLDARVGMARYVRHVLEEEWGQLGEDERLHDRAWAEWSAAYAFVLDLEPQTPRQDALKGILLENVREISMLRRMREDAARNDVSPLFLTAALVGVVLTAAAYFTFAPTRLNLFLLAVFASYTGLIVFFIAAFSNPYLKPGIAQPVGFELLYQGDIRTLGEGTG